MHVDEGARGGGGGDGREKGFEKETQDDSCGLRVGCAGTQVVGVRGLRTWLKRFGIAVVRALPDFGDPDQG